MAHSFLRQKPVHLEIAFQSTMGESTTFEEPTPTAAHSALMEVLVDQVLCDGDKVQLGAVELCVIGVAVPAL